MVTTGRGEGRQAQSTILVGYQGISRLRRFFSRPRRRHVAPRFRERSSDAARCPSAVVGYKVFNLIPSVRVLDCEPVRSRLARPLPQDYDHLPLGGTQIIVHISPHRLSICLWGRSAVDDRLRPRSLLHFNPVRGAAPSSRPGPTTGDRRATDQSARSARQIPGLHNFQAAPVLANNPLAPLARLGEAARHSSTIWGRFISRSNQLAIHRAVRGEILTVLPSILMLNRDRKLIPSSPSMPSPYAPPAWTTIGTSLATSERS
jgi:hypothetical protein